MRDERRKKERSKQGQTNKVKQTTRQSNTAHPMQSLFLRIMSCLGWDSNPQHSRQSALPLSTCEVMSKHINRVKRAHFATRQLLSLETVLLVDEVRGHKISVAGH